MVRVDDRFNLYFNHHPVSREHKVPLDTGIDLLYEKPWEYLEEHYTRRVQRMLAELSKGCKPVFVVQGPQPGPDVEGQDLESFQRLVQTPSPFEVKAHAQCEMPVASNVELVVAPGLPQDQVARLLLHLPLPRPKPSPRQRAAVRGLVGGLL